MTTYTTGCESPATLHARPPAGFASGQARALRALLAQAYGKGAQLDRELVAAWAALVVAWPPAAGQQEDPPQPPV